MLSKGGIENRNNGKQVPGSAWHFCVLWEKAKAPLALLCFILFRRTFVQPTKGKRKTLSRGQSRGMLNAHYQIFVSPCPDSCSHKGTSWHPHFKHDPLCAALRVQVVRPRTVWLMLWIKQQLSLHFDSGFLSFLQVVMKPWLTATPASKSGRPSGSSRILTNI